MNFSNLIYGNDLDSLAYSYLTGIPIVMNNPRYPLFFEYFKPEHNLSLLNVINEKNQIKTPDIIIQLNDSKINVFKKLLLFQSLLGKIKFTNIKYARLEDNNRLNVLTQRLSYDLEFDKLYIINDNFLDGIEHEVEHEKSTVLERFHITKRLPFDYDLFTGDFNLHMTYGIKSYVTMESFVDKDKIDDMENSLFYCKQRIIKTFQKYGRDLVEYKDAIRHVNKTVYDNDVIKYNESDFVKQIRFSLEDYLCQKKTLQSLDVYPFIVGSKFTSMSTQTF